MSIFRRKQNSEPVNSTAPDSSESQPTQADIEGAWGLGPATEESIRMVGSNATPLAIAEAELATEKTDAEEAHEEVEELPPLLEKFDLKGRVQDAIRECEIQPSAEVQKALEGYYTDHYELIDILDHMLSDTPQDLDKLQEIVDREDAIVEKEELSKLLEVYEYLAFPTPPSAETASRLIAQAVLQREQAETEEQKEHAHQMLLRCASRCLDSVLFQETSLGITTLRDADLALIPVLHEKLMHSVQGNPQTRIRERDEYSSFEWFVNNRHQRVSVSTASYIRKQIEQKQSRFWEDCRMAGQLEFHSTGHMPLISRRGNKLLPRTEQFRRHGTMHVQTAAQEAMHSVVPHFGERLDPNGYRNAGYSSDTDVQDKGSATIAIPLADIIRVAPFARDAEYAIVQAKDHQATSRKIPQPTSSTTSIGSGENDFEGQHGPDRVFFASPRTEDEPDSYEIKLGRTSTLLFFGQDESNQDPTYGTGEGFPLHISTKYPGYPPELYERQRQFLEDSMYAGKIVVPLRRGVFNFNAENMFKYSSAGRKGSS